MKISEKFRCAASSSYSITTRRKSHGTLHFCVVKKAVLHITNGNLIVKRFPHGYCHLAACLRSCLFLLAVAVVAFSKFAAKRTPHTIPVLRNRVDDAAGTDIAWRGTPRRRRTALCCVRPVLWYRMTVHVGQDLE